MEDRVRLSNLCQVLNKNGLSALLEGPDVEIRAVSTLEEASEGEIPTIPRMDRYRRRARHHRSGYGAAAVAMRRNFVLKYVIGGR